MRALLSVYDKTGIVEFARGLHNAGYALISSGGTARVLMEAGVEVTPVEKYTGAPEMLDGRVKTLHPKIHAGILADRHNESHMQDLRNNDCDAIDVVVCNLYPFAETRAQTNDRKTLIEKIDIGGPTMLRAAAKNMDGGVTVICSPNDYAVVLAEIEADGITVETRARLMVKTFAHVTAYDQDISNWLNSLNEAPDTSATLPAVVEGFTLEAGLRYGENPDQKAGVYHNSQTGGGVAQGEFVGGKALSYNNYLDLDAAQRCASDMGALDTQQHCCAIIKHTNPCGLALRNTQAGAFTAALSGDPMSAFGSVIGFNAPMEVETAQALAQSKLFVECLVAPDFTAGAREILGKKKNLRWLRATPPTSGWTSHYIGGGLLLQQQDPGLADPNCWECVTEKQPESGWLDELRFAMGAVRLLKSNAISISRDQQLCGMGTGQTSRIDALEQSIKKAGEKTTGAFLASDAFFPFDDCVRTAATAGIVAIVQPGGSKRDDESIAACNELGLCMVLSGRRHFRH